MTVCTCLWRGVVFALSDCDCVRGCKPSECVCDGFFAFFLEVFLPHIS